MGFGGFAGYLKGGFSGLGVKGFGEGSFKDCDKSCHACLGFVRLQGLGFRRFSGELVVRAQLISGSNHPPLEERSSSRDDALTVL